MMLARDLSNDFSKKYLEMSKSGASPEALGEYLREHGQYHSQCLGDADNAETLETRGDRLEWTQSVADRLRAAGNRKTGGVETPE